MDELSEAELRYYNDLFKICSDSAEKSSSNYDSSGKIPALKATSLFRSANLSNEIINKSSAENNVTTIHLDASGNMTHSTRGGSLTGGGGGPSIQTAPHNSAFEVYRKPSQQQLRGSQSPTQPPPPPLVASRSVESSSHEYEKRISLLSDSLRQVRFKGSETAHGPDVLKHLKEQNLLLLRICSDLSEELLQIQQKREDIRIKIELQEQNLGAGPKP